MKSYTVHVSDPSGYDDSTEVTIEEIGQLGQAVHEAIDQMVSDHGGEFDYPVFIDIHPTAAFVSKEWMYQSTVKTNKPHVNRIPWGK